MVELQLSMPQPIPTPANQTGRFSKPSLHCFREHAALHVCQSLVTPMDVRWGEFPVSFLGLWAASFSVTFQWLDPISLHEMGKIQRLTESVSLSFSVSHEMLINGLGIMSASLLLRWHTQVHNLILWDSMVMFINVLKTCLIFRATSVGCSNE